MAKTKAGATCKPWISSAIKSACYERSDGADYRGGVSKTRSGFVCQSWKEKKKAVDGRDGFWAGSTGAAAKGIGDHSACRNPDGEAAPWCYLGDANWAEHECAKEGGTCACNGLVRLGTSMIKTWTAQAASSSSLLCKEASFPNTQARIGHKAPYALRKYSWTHQAKGKKVCMCKPFSNTFPRWEVCDVGLPSAGCTAAASAAGLGVLRGVIKKYGSVRGCSHSTLHV